MYDKTSPNCISRFVAGIYAQLVSGFLWMASVSLAGFRDTEADLTTVVALCFYKDYITAELSQHFGSSKV
jgi:hypothetical protein